MAALVAAPIAVVARAPSTPSSKRHSVPASRRAVLAARTARKRSHAQRRARWPGYYARARQGRRRGRFRDRCSPCQIFASLIARRLFSVFRVADIPGSVGKAQTAVCGRLRVGKDLLHVAGFVGAVMCSACRCGSHDHWPLCSPWIRFRSKAPARRCDGTSGLSRSPDRPALHYAQFASRRSHHAGSDAISLRCKRDGLLLSLALGLHDRGHPRNQSGKCQ